MIKRQQRDQLRQKTADELRKDVTQAHQELTELKMKGQQTALVNVHQQLHLRRKIAQLQTLIQAKDLS